jgi:hypothetical protein
MEIEIGSAIKIICQNNMIEAGILLEYSDDQLVLEQLDKSVVIINDPKKNVLAIKIFGQKEQKSIAEGMAVEKVIPKQSSVYIEPIKEDEFKPFIRDESLRVKNLAELHLLRANEERSRAAELLKSSNILKEMPEVKFGTPDFTKSIPKHPPKKIGRRGS